MPDTPDDAPLPTEEERAAFNGMTVEQLRAPHPFQEESEARREARIAKEARDEAAPVAALRRLAIAPLGTTHLFAQYKRSSQLSALIQIVRDETGATFACRREHSLVDASIAGVRVTLMGKS